ncbi:MAG TPA: phosphatase PAP2 family protein [Alphaproteobacteria bacterium]|nr:phosphatase PAP2 family protein [Alphaproteobacteria bacterium]
MKIQKPLLFGLGAILLTQSAFARGRAPTIDEHQMESLGSILQFAIPLSGLAYSTYIKDWEGDWQFAKAYGSTFVTTEVLKYTVHADRPRQPDGIRGVSFPSGHTSSAFVGAAYWQRRYGWAIGAPMYAAASFVGYSRIRSKTHNWADVIGGAVIGTGFGYLFTSRYSDSTNVSVEPTDGGAYLHFSTKF